MKTSTFALGAGVLALALLSLIVPADALGLADPDSPRPSSPPDAPPADPRTAATTAQRDVAEAIAGTYHFVGGHHERVALEAAIEKVVSRMNVLVRGAARSRLRDSNPIAAKLVLRPEGERISIAFDDREYEAGLDGAPVEVVGITGDTLRYRVDVSSDGLRQVFDGDRGGRTNTMKVGNDRMVVNVEVRSERLPEPLRYRLTFARVPKAK